MKTFQRWLGITVGLVLVALLVVGFAPDSNNFNNTQFIVTGQTISLAHLNASLVDSGTLNAGQFPALTGDVTTPGGSLVTTLATVNANVGTFGDATHVGQFTANAKGLITAASSVAITGIPPGGAAGGVLSGTYPNPGFANITAHSYLGNNTAGAAAPVAVTTLDTSLMPALTGDITTPGASLATTLKNTGTAGTYTKTTFDAQGRETSGTAAVLASADFANQGTTTQVLHGNPAGNPSWGSVALATDVSGTLAAANFPALTGDITTPGGSLATTLATVNGSPGTFGDATHTVTATVNGKGLITALSQNTIIGLAQVRTIDIPMGAWFTNNCGNGADVSAASMLTLTNAGDTPVFTFNATTTNEIRTRFSMPEDWDNNPVRIHTFWACSGTNSQAQAKTNLVVHYDATAVGAADRLDNLTFGTAVFWTNNVNPFPWEQGLEGITGDLTVGNSPAKGKGIVWRIQGLGNASGTTVTNSSVFLAHVTVEYRSISANTFSTPQ